MITAQKGGTYQSMSLSIRISHTAIQVQVRYEYGYQEPEGRRPEAGETTFTCQFLRVGVQGPL